MTVLTAPIRNFIRRSGSQTAAPLAAEQRKTATIVPAIEIPINDPLYLYCLSSQGVIEVDRLKIESEALEQLRAAGIRLMIPLVNQGELVGMLQLGNRLSDQEYSSDDFRLLNNLAPQAAAALRVAQLAYQQQVEARRRERIEQELRVAGIIQQTLLPKEVPSIEGWQLATHWQPARSVGGDFYDFVPLSDGRLMITIGDVTDKGVPAALVMASTRTVLRAAAERLVAPGEILRRANDVLCPDMPPKMFVTCLVAVLELRTGRMQYANAGHNAAQQRTKDGVIELRARGMPLGLMPGMTYEEKETVLARGDTVLMYSDGLVEAHNSEREMFGMKRLQALLNEHPGGDTLISYLKDALFAFTGADWEQEDDVTLVVVEYETEAPAPDDQGGWKTLDEFEVPSAVGGERAVMERVAQAARVAELPEARIERLKTAVAEATMNAMEHGNHYQPELPVKIRVARSSDELAVSVTDKGGSPVIASPTPDLQAKLSGEQSPRGWGLFLIKAMVDDLRIHADSAEHTIELIFKLQGEHHAESEL
ncbi:MAG: SpoIIE family protein phosphatase [Chloroflexi bacterium]|nr:SpoIIE family protein phosphatase [Chloroflexota bacterium]